MNEKPEIVPTWRNARQIAGYRARLVAELVRDRSGAEITIDLTTAGALRQICEQLIYLERKARM